MFSKKLVYFLSLLWACIALDQPVFWNLAQISLGSSTPQTQFNFYFGWDTTQTYVYFRIKGNYKGWIALGFGDNLSQMDMIVLRLKQLRVEAEDRYSTNDKQIPQLNMKYKDTFLIKGDRNAAGDWDVIFKRKAVSIDPRKITLDVFQRYITILLGDINDVEFTKLKVISQVFKITFTTQQLCHQSCAVGKCTGPSDSECTGCDSNRVLYRSSCILKQPLQFTQITPTTCTTIEQISFGYSPQNDYFYIKFQQQSGWKFWMGVMFNYGSTTTGYTDFYVVYKTTTQKLVSDYFIDPTTNIVTEDEVMGDGDNDAFISDSDSNTIIMIRKVDTGSQYDQVFNLNTTFNMTVFLGTKDFFESETQPYQNQCTITSAAPGISKKCNPNCINCYYDDSNSNCVTCSSSTALIATTGSVTSCTPSSSPVQMRISSIDQSSQQQTNKPYYLINDSNNTIQYYFIPGSSSFLSMSFSINLQKFQQPSPPIQIPKLNTDVDFNAVSLYLESFYTSPLIIFLFCDSNTVMGIQLQSASSSDPSSFTKSSTQQIAVYPGGSCNGGILKANVMFSQNLLYVAGTSYSQYQLKTVNLNLHVSYYDFKYLSVYSLIGANPLTGQSYNLIPTPPAYCSTQTAAVITPTSCVSCNSGVTSPYCCSSNYILQGCTSQQVVNYWNTIKLNSTNVVVSYSINGDTIFFRYSITTKNTVGAFGCGFNANSTNTDMMVYSFGSQTVQDSFSYGYVIPVADFQQDIQTISTLSSPSFPGYEVVFARKIAVANPLNTQDQDLTSYKTKSGPFICYLGSTADLHPTSSEVYYNNAVQFSSTQICHPTCQTCSCSPTPPAPCYLKCTTCISGYNTDLSVPMDQCIQSPTGTCSIQRCLKCSGTSCILCNSVSFLYNGLCFPIVPDLPYLNDFKVNFSTIGFSLQYGFDSTKSYIYLNIQGVNQGYVALGFGSHSQLLDIIMMQNSVSNNPVVTDMYSQKQIFCAQDTANNVAYVSGGYNNGFWNITVFRALVSSDLSQDLSIDLVNTNTVSIALGQDQFIGYHITNQVVSSTFQYVQAQGGQVNYTNTYIQQKADIYNKLELPKFNTSLYYGFDQSGKFIYFKLVGKPHLNWFGIGFGNSMTSTDMIIVRYTTNKSGQNVFVTEDRFSDGQKMPRLDIQQDVLMIKSTDTTTLTATTNSTVEFVRKLNTNDQYSEDFSITYSTTTKQTASMDFIFAMGVGVDFTTTGHSAHQLMRNVTLIGTQDCSQCDTGTKCNGPDIKDCINQTGTSIVAFSVIGVQLLTIILFVGLLI